MDSYDSYQISLQPKTTLITPLQSDTIFGHIAWAIRYIYGEEKLIKFLNEFKDNSDAPLLVSDGFPSGYLPKPYFKALPQHIVEKFIIAETVKNDINLSTAQLTQIQKSLKNLLLLKKDTITKIQADFTAENLLRVSLEEIFCYEFSEEKNEYKISSNKTEAVVMYHNTINRIYNQVLEGFYQQVTNFFATDFSFEVYLITNYFSNSELLNIFEFIEKSGFGRDKSTGKGNFEITLRKEAGLPVLKDANAFMTLSHYIPDHNSPLSGYYRLLTKYGKLGGDFASSIIPGIEQYYGTAKPKVHPFKKPILMMRPGSVFMAKPSNKYGILLGGNKRNQNLQIHKYPDIRHFGYAFPLGLKIDDKELSQ